MRVEIDTKNGQMLGRVTPRVHKEYTVSQRKNDISYAVLVSVGSVYNDGISIH